LFQASFDQPGQQPAGRQAQGNLSQAKVDQTFDGQ
jgi:hypothetical protein